MDKKRIILFPIAIVMVLGLAVTVYGQAAPMKDILTEIVEGLGLKAASGNTNTLATFYTNYYYFVDAILFFILFLAIAKMAIGERFHKTAYTVVGIALAIGMMMFEANNKWNIGMLGPLAAAIFALLVGFVIFHFVRMIVGRDMATSTWGMFLAIGTALAVMHAVMPKGLLVFEKVPILSMLQRPGIAGFFVLLGIIGIIARKIKAGVVARGGIVAEAKGVAKIQDDAAEAKKILRDSKKARKETRKLDNREIKDIRKVEKDLFDIVRTVQAGITGDQKNYFDNIKNEIEDVRKRFKHLKKLETLEMTFLLDGRFINEVGKGNTASLSENETQLILILERLTDRIIQICIKPTKTGYNGATKLAEIKDNVDRADKVIKHLIGVNKAQL
ncbi:MAG: hypothetical protein ABIC04_02110 [Nanoarchaeota archaeon]